MSAQAQSTMSSGGGAPQAQSSVLFRFSGKTGGTARATAPGPISQGLTPSRNKEAVTDAFTETFFGTRWPDRDQMPDPAADPRPAPARRIGAQAWPSRIGFPITDPQVCNTVDGLPSVPGHVAEYRMGGSSTSV